MNPVPLISVIIPVYNRAAMARRAIESVLAQTFRDFELILVDDGSTDETPAILEEYRERAAVIHIPHRGVSAARNAGIRASHAPWVAFLDSDDEWLPSKLGRHADYITAHPDTAIHQTRDIWIRNGRRVNPGKKHRKREGRFFIESLERCLISPSAVVMARRLFEEHGMFDEAMPACEDYDLWLRVTEREWVGLVPESLTVRYAGHNGQLSSRYWGMDRFRVYAIVKLLRERGMTMRESYRAAAIQTAREKLGIIRQGAAKRDKVELCRRIDECLSLVSAGVFEPPLFLFED